MKAGDMGASTVLALMLVPAAALRPFALPHARGVAPVVARRAFGLPRARCLVLKEVNSDTASYYEEKLCDAVEEECEIPDPDEFTVAILGDLHLDPRKMEDYYIGREHFKPILEDAQSRGVATGLVSLGDLGESKTVRPEETQELFAGTTECHELANEFLSSFDGVEGYEVIGGNHDLEGIDEFATDEGNLEAFLRVHKKPTMQFCKTIAEKTLLVGLGSTVFRTAKYTSHEVTIDDEQLCALPPTPSEDPPPSHPYHPSPPKTRRPPPFPRPRPAVARTSPRPRAPHATAVIGSTRSPCAARGLRICSSSTLPSTAGACSSLRTRRRSARGCVCCKRTMWSTAAAGSTIPAARTATPRPRPSSSRCATPLACARAHCGEKLRRAALRRVFVRACAAQLVRKHRCIKAWFSGHFHLGQDYQDSITFPTIPRELGPCIPPPQTCRTRHLPPHLPPCLPPPCHSAVCAHGPRCVCRPFVRQTRTVAAVSSRKRR
jgi:hypothetical protein